MTLPRPLSAAALPSAEIPLTAALNALLARQPQARMHLQRHLGKTLRLALPLHDLRLRLEADDGFVPAREAAENDTPDDLILTPNPAYLPHWLRGGSLTALFTAQGDGLFAADLGHALADFDLVLALRPYLGDIAASRATQFLHALHDWRRQAAESFGRNLAEYAIHEQAMLAAPHAVHAFIAEIDRLREDSDRLEARLQWLETRREV